MQILEQHFDAAFDAPDGIKKLRELILTLAMQGKLVEQDPDDQPASELLKEIEAEKRRLVAEGKIKAPKPLPPIEADEVPYQVPLSWAWVNLINIGYWAIGSGLPHIIQGNKNGEILLCKVSDMNIVGNEKFINSTNNYLPLIEAKKHKFNIHSSRTIIFPKIGGAISTNKRRIILEPTIIDNNCLGITLWSGIDLEWAYRLLTSIDMMEYQTGTSIPALSQGVIELIPIPLPPLAEQRRIVARIDELMARCDELEALRASREQKRLNTHTAALNALLSAKAPDAFAEAWQFVAEHFGELHSAPKNVAELRKAVLQLAVMGKLVPQDPSDLPARELLREIEAEKNRLIVAGNIRASKPLPPVAEEEKPYQIPEGWEWVRLSEITLISGGVTKGRNLVGRQVIEVPYLRVANVQRSYLNLEEIKYIDLPIDEVKKYSLLNGDLLITEGGDWDKVGRTAIWGGEIETCVHQNHVFKARKTLSVQNEVWLEKYLNSPFSRAYFAGAAKQTTNLASINMTQLQYCPVAVPPPLEQHRIVAKIDQFMALCDQLEAGLAAQTGKQTELLNAVMAAVTPASTTPTRRAPARAQVAWTDPEASEAAEPKRRGRPAKVQAEVTGIEGEVAAPRRRGRPPKNPVVVSASIPSATSEADAIRRLEALKLERSRGERQVGLFDTSHKG
jgi:type I restriction enzyme, S subunit